MGISYFVFDGRSSRDMGLIVTGRGVHNAPERAVEAISVPGRNGALIIDQGRYENVTIPYEVQMLNHLADKARAIKAWLLGGSAAYRRLEDTYDPGYYRMARLYGGISITEMLCRYGQATLEFDCRPQKYSKDGGHKITITAQTQLVNPEAFASLPYMRIYGSGAVDMHVNSNTVHINAIDGYIELDSETQNAYKGTENKNSTVNAAGFPKLEAGINTIQWDGAVTRIEIIPRWWTL